MDGPLHVLILEDRPADAELMIHTLEQADFKLTWRRVDTEPDYRAALEQDPDVILADHSLPQYDSIRALRALKESGRDIPFVIVSGTINEELAVSLLREGASDYVLKHNLVRLGPAVAQALEQTRLRQQKRRAEEEAWAIEARFRALIEHSADGIVLLDAAGTVLYGSLSTAGILGCPVNEWVGQKLSDFLHPEDGERIGRLLAGLIGRTGESTHVEGRIRHRDGAWRWLEGTMTNLLSEPSVLALVCNYRDVTAYHNAEEAVRQSEQRLRLAMEGAQLGTWDWDLQTDVVSWWPGPEQAPHASEGAFRGALANYLDHVHCDDRTGLATAIEKARQTGSAFQHECRVVWPEGSTRWLAGRGQFTRDDAGRPVRMLGVFMDVSERKATEERLRASLAEKEVLLREVHHRVKNNLQVISSLLQLQAQHADGANAVELLRESQGRVRSMALVHERLYRSGDLSQIDFAEYLRSLAASLVRTYQTDNRRIRLTFEVEPVRLSLDTAVPCGLVVNELLSNALKHAFLDRSDGEVRVSLRQAPDGQVELGVADDGVGLPEPFTVTASPTFGFRLIAALVEQLHGALEVGRERGTAVRIVFPLQHGSPSRNGMTTATGN